jgi:hypothetical protein
MKKINVLLLGVLVLVTGFFGSCKKDENAAAPEITFDAATNPVTLGTGVTSYAVTGEIYSEAGLDVVKVFKVSDSGAKTEDKSISSFSAGEITTTDKITYTFRFNYTGISSTLKIQVRATDKNGKETDSEILVINPAAAATLKSYTATLYNGLWYTDSGKGAFIDLETGTTYSQTGSGAILSTTDQAKVDLLYWYGSSTTYTLASPNDATAQGTDGSAATKSWTTRNATKLKIVTITQTWANLTVANVDSYATSFGADTKETNLTVGTIIAFQTVGGKNGLIKVDAVSGTSGSKTDNASVSIVVEQ